MDVALIFLGFYVVFLVLAFLLAVFAVLVLATNCLPCLEPAIFFRFVAAFWVGVSLFHALSGR